MSIENLSQKTEDEQAIERSSLNLNELDWELLRAAQSCQEETQEYFQKMINFWKIIEAKNAGHPTPRLKLMALEVRLNESRGERNEIHID